MNTIWLDITRLLERAVVGTLTGIDRVELAYAETLLTLAPERTRFVTLGRWSSRFTLLPTRSAQRFITGLRQAWDTGHATECRGGAMRLMARASLALRAPVDPSATYLLVSHRHLHRRRALAQALQRSRTAFVPLVHDLIPLEFPEYGRPGESARHAVRITTVAHLADGIVVNSAATGAALAPYITAGRAIHIAPLGISPPPAAVVPEQADRPYFLCVGTIEPRKNHLLLLHLWRHLANLLGDKTPQLRIVGARGWENENILDLLDRCEVLRGHVVELGTIPDARLSALMCGARALLMPSFAEGFGLPVAEALAHGTPVLCSNLPALREAGGIAPEYLDPLDTPAWQTAVLDYTAKASPRRIAQCERMRDWSPIDWQSHVSSVVDFAATVNREMRKNPSPATHYPRWMVRDAQTIAQNA